MATKNAAMAAARAAALSRTGGSAAARMPLAPSAALMRLAARHAGSTTKDQQSALKPWDSSAKGEPKILEPMHPSQIYLRQMRRLRKQYRKETADAKKASDEHDADSVNAADAHRASELERFRKEREDFLRGIDSFTAPMPMPSPVDAVLNQGAGDAWWVKRMREESAAKNTKTDQDGAPLDSIIEERRELWRKYRELRRVRRFNNMLAKKDEEARTRLDSLTYLFYSASEFVTYRNMEERIEAAIASPPPMLVPIPSRLTAAEQRDGGLFESARSGSVGDAADAHSRRMDALKNAVLGTIDGKPDAQSLRVATKRRLESQAAAAAMAAAETKESAPDSSQTEKR